MPLSRHEGMIDVNLPEAVAAPRVVAVMPVGPGTVEDFARDTIESVLHHGVTGTRVIVVDNSGVGLGERIARSARVEAVLSGGALGGLGGLYLADSVGFRAALEQPFDLLLRIDTDGLVIGSGWEHHAIEVFAADPRTALLGPYRTAHDGRPRDCSYAARSFRSSTRWRRLRNDPRQVIVLRRLLSKARSNGWRDGESVLGGICVFHRRGLEGLQAAALLGHPALGRLPMPDDQILSMLLASQGFTLAPFGTAADDLPMAAVWKGMPDHPEALLAAGKKLVHSTKSYGDMDERGIRAMFAAARAGVATQA